VSLTRVGSDARGERKKRNQREEAERENGEAAAVGLLRVW